MSTFSVLLVPILHFKEINDTLGHRVGDSLVVEVAARVSSDELLARADVAMCLARSRNGAWAVYDPGRGDPSRPWAAVRGCASNHP